jgi:threonylcarbamoyladenosine tRNA methylthiotransferase MtaB
VGGRYYVETFGCRVNQADSAGLAADLDLSEHERVRSIAEADLVILNTCTVTHRSDADVRKAVHRLQRERPEAKVVVTGCYAQRAPEEVARIEGVHLVVGNAHKKSLPVLSGQLLDHPHAAPIVVHSTMDGVDPLELPPVEPVTTVLDRTRPFVKIQDGCDATCTYCIIPSVRGPARSATPERILGAVATLIAAGHQEIVLAGVHLGTYGLGLPAGEREDLTGLVRRILAQPGLMRLRLSCIEPMAFPMDLVDLAAQDRRLQPHFHLPLQAGADRILKRMVRPYRAADYLEVMQEIRKKVPNACLGTDVIVGFPGESEAEFQESCRLVQAADLDYVHVFSYSDREGTASTRLDEKIDPRIIKERSGELHRVSRELFHKFLDRQLGQHLEVLTLEPDAAEPEWTSTLSANYAPVRVKGHLAANRLLEVEIVGKEGATLIGRLPSPAPP